VFKKLTIIFFVFISNFSFLYADIITVDNKFPSVGQYKTLQKAHDAAKSGDSIYVYPSKEPYGDLVISKKLTITGSIMLETSTVKTISLTGNSAGSIIDSLNVKNIHIHSENNTIRNNSNIGSIYVNAENTIRNNSNIEFININADNVLIKQNIISRITIAEGHEGNEILQNKIVNSYCGIHIQKFNTVIIKNNIIQPTKYQEVIRIDSACNISLLNNVFNSNNGSFYLSPETHAFFVNNIIYTGRISSLGEYHYNLFYSTDDYPTSNNNIKGNPNFTNEYHLGEDSPAVGAGQNGTDMGIYGGDTPYVEWDNSNSILPRITHIKAEPVVAEGTQGLEINIKANAGRE